MNREPQQITSVDLEQRFVQFASGERVPVTHMYTDDNRETDDVDQCTKLVAGSDAAGWVAVAVRREG